MLLLLEHKPGAWLAFLATGNSSHEVPIRLIAIHVRVGEASCGGDRRGIELYCIAAIGRAINIECDIIAICSQQSPTHECSVVATDRHHATAKSFHLPLGVGDVQQKKHDNRSE